MWLYFLKTVAFSFFPVLFSLNLLHFLHQFSKKIRKFGTTNENWRFVFCQLLMLELVSIFHKFIPHMFQSTPIHKLISGRFHGHLLSWGVLCSWHLSIRRRFTAPSFFSKCISEDNNEAYSCLKKMWLHVLFLQPGICSIFKTVFHQRINQKLWIRVIQMSKWKQWARKLLCWNGVLGWNFKSWNVVRRCDPEQWKLPRSLQKDTVNHSRSMAGWFINAGTTCAECI